MTVFNVEPLKKVNDIEFGMDRKNIRELYDNKYNAFKKTIFSKNTTDDFMGVHVYYDSKDKCEAVEIFSETDVNIDGKQIFPISLDEAYEVFPFLAEDEDGPLSIEKSIGIYAPDGEMESILFGKEGYYDYL